MTIALGFKCSDGIVLCADSLVTKGDRLGYYEAKFFIISPSILSASKKKWIVATVYSGFADSMKRINSFLQKSLHSLPQVTVVGVRKILEDILSSEYKRHKAELNRLEIFCAISVEHEPLELLRSSAATVTEGNFECAGIGDSPLIRLLHEVMSPVGILNTDQALLLAVYMVQQAKRYMPQWCGGDTHAFKILRDGEILPFIKPLEIEEITRELEFGLSQVLSYFGNSDPSPFEFERECERFVALLKKIREKSLSLNGSVPNEARN